jgi:hypothetical protein
MELTVKELFGYFWNFGLPVVMFAIIIWTGSRGDVWVWARENKQVRTDCDYYKAGYERLLGHFELSLGIAEKMASKKMVG